MIDATLSTRASGMTLPIMPQSAALCYRFVQGQPKILLITTRKSGRWIIPKGWLIKGLSPSGTAQQEAWEEAGVRGTCNEVPLGQYFYQKRRAKKGDVVCAVDVFPLLVQSSASRFPECGQRQKCWVSPEKAALRVNSPDLALLFRKLGPVTH
ncbi:NUDIX hydrolase [Ruegeria sp.]|uniref:NUDIX hydrolase n=1 Tax=Ruegeria sp. TaxID=1879320 RepID=UPI003B5A7007